MYPSFVFLNMVANQMFKRYRTCLCLPTCLFLWEFSKNLQRCPTMLSVSSCFHFIVTGTSLDKYVISEQTLCNLRRMRVLKRELMVLNASWHNVKVKGVRRARMRLRGEFCPALPSPFHRRPSSHRPLCVIPWIWEEESRPLYGGLVITLWRIERCPWHLNAPAAFTFAFTDPWVHPPRSLFGLTVDSQSFIAFHHVYFIYGDGKVRNGKRCENGWEAQTDCNCDESKLSLQPELCLFKIQLQISVIAL